MAEHARPDCGRQASAFRWFGLRVVPAPGEHWTCCRECTGTVKCENDDCAIFFFWLRLGGHKTIVWTHFYIFLFSLISRILLLATTWCWTRSVNGTTAWTRTCSALSSSASHCSTRSWTITPMAWDRWITTALAKTRYEGWWYRSAVGVKMRLWRQLYFLQVVQLIFKSITRSLEINMGWFQMYISQWLYVRTRREPLSIWLRLFLKA